MRRATRQTRYATGWTRARMWSCGAPVKDQARQRRGINPNSIFVTEKRVIIRSPVTFGLGEHIEEYFYHQITNVRLEKGVMSASLVFYIPGMTELSKSEGRCCGGRASAAQLTPYQRRTQKRYTITSGEDPRRQGSCETAGGDRKAKRHRRTACNHKGRGTQGARSPGRSS